MVMIILLHILQIFFRLIAPFFVPIALLFAKKTDERNKTWAPHRDDEFPEKMRRLPRSLKFLETPDDQLIPSGLYEDTVLNIYKKYGWFISQWYWLGFRNVGHGFFYKYGYNTDQEPTSNLVKTKDFGPFQIRYGHKILRDWYGVFGGEYYAMPRFTIRFK